LSEGLISGLRGEDPRVPLIQTTAPISPGSSGGGLFDADGRLVGITTLIFVGRERLAQSINFALPADWIREVPERAAAALAKRKEQAAARTTSAAAATPGGKPPASPALPDIGASWKYRYSDLKYGRITQDFTLRVTGIDGWTVTESLERSGKAAGQRASQASIGAQDLAFSERILDSGRSFVEFAPYLLATEMLDRPLPWRDVGAAYPVVRSGGAAGWKFDGSRHDREQVQVQAGTYQAVRVEISGQAVNGRDANLSRPGYNLAIRFRYTLWYAPEVKRYVKIRQQTWDLRDAEYSDEVIELLEYKGG
jgi:hypothetical protein